MNKKEREMIAFIGYIHDTTNEQNIKKRAKELLQKHWVHPKEDEH